MLNLKRDMLSVALASALVAMASQAQAQAQAAKAEEEEEAKAADAKKLDAVIVTASIRRGIEDAIENKQNATSIVESISAEGIGQLPDQSIADSIARLPGLTAVRNQRTGRAQEINVRGLSGDFATATLNGREQVSLAQARGVEFDAYPSELLSSVLVYKTPEARLVGQGLSATIDLRTVRPLDFDDRVMALTARYEQNRLNEEKESGYRTSFSYIDQNDARTMGLALGYARLNNPGQGREFEAWGYDNGAIGGGKIYDYESENERDGLMATLEFRPSDDYRTSFDFFYSRYDRQEDKRGLEFGTTWGGASVASRTNNSQGTGIDVTWTNVRPIIRNDVEAFDDRLMSIGWNHEIKFGDYWTFTADINGSQGKRDQRILETYAVLPNGVGDTLRAIYNPEGYFDLDFGLDYSNPSLLRLADPGGWGGDRAQAGYLKDFEIKDSLVAARFDLERRFDEGAISSLRFGLNYNDRDKSRGSLENTLCLTSGCEASNNVQLPIPANFVIGSTTVFGGTNIVAFDTLNLLNSGVYRLLVKDDKDITNKNWTVSEEVTSAYVQANLDTEFLGNSLLGNVGVQVQHVSQEGTGFATYAGAPLGVPIRDGDRYTDVLPSLNLRWGLPADQVLRFAAARQVARPRMDDMRASRDFGIRTSGNTSPGCAALPCFSGGGGNPKLRPWEANAYDLSYEKYFDGTRGYVSVAYFFKDLKTYIYGQTIAFDYSGLPIPPGTPPSAIPASRIGEYSAPVNGEGGLLKGWELSVSLPFDLLWEPLKGFGFQGSYTDTTTSVEPDGPGSTQPLPGFSKYTSNASLYYEDHGFQVRVSRRTRSAFRSTFQGFGGDLNFRNFAGEEVVDAQLGYTFQSGPLKDLAILLQAGNLTDEASRELDSGREDRPLKFYEYGKYYLLGVNYRF